MMNLGFRKKKSLAAVLAIIVLSLLITGQAAAASKKGAWLNIEKTDGTTIQAELLAVRKKTLLLLDNITPAAWTLDISEIRSILIRGNPTNMLYSLGVGLPLGSMLAIGLENPYKFYAPIILGGISCTLGVLLSVDKTYRIEGRTTEEIDRILRKLKDKARVRTKFNWPG